MDRENKIDVNKKVDLNKEDLNKVDKDGFTPLIRAVLLQDYQLIRYLLKSGADINSLSSKNVTALIKSILITDKISVHLLLNEGADIDAENYSGLTALMYTSFFEEPWFLKKLLERKPSLDKVDRSGSSALNYAVSFDLYSHVSYLLNAGANYYLKDYLGLSILENPMRTPKVDKLLTDFKYEVSSLRVNLIIASKKRSACDKHQYLQHAFERACLNSKTTLLSANYLLRISHMTSYPPLEPHLLENFQNHYSHLVSKTIVSDLTDSNSKNYYEGLIGKITQYCDESSLNALKIAAQKGQKTLMFSTRIKLPSCCKNNSSDQKKDLLKK